IRRMQADKEKQKAEAPASLFAANENARSFMEESLGTDGFGKAFMTLGKRSLKVEGTIGDGLARFVLLRYLVSMNRMMEVQQERMKEMQKRNEEQMKAATEKAAEAVQEVK
ncbi:hypothetical protein OAH18_03825, partial [bacterium]|nr:hypothetical protein [bacterium]